MVVLSRLELHADNNKPELVFMEQVEEVSTELQQVSLFTLCQSQALYSQCSHYCAGIIPSESEREFDTFLEHVLLVLL
jgi:hypothetical protein